MKDKKIAKNAIKKKNQNSSFSNDQWPYRDSNKQMNERRESVQNDLPENISVV